MSFIEQGRLNGGDGLKLIIQENPKSLIFGTSATPYRYFESRDMSSELFKNNIASDLSLPKAIAKKILPSPKYVYGIYNLKEESEKIISQINNARKLTEEKKTDYKNIITNYKVDFERSGGMPEILNKYLNKNDNKFLVFCEDIEHLEIMELEV